MTPEGPITDVGVAAAPCADATINRRATAVSISGIISDLTVGPFSALAIPAVSRLTGLLVQCEINAAGGIGGYDVIVSPPTTPSTPSTTLKLTVQGYTQIEPERALMLAQSLGHHADDRNPGPAGCRQHVVTVPATWWSGWAFSEKATAMAWLLEAGANYCHEAMNDFDFALSQFGADMKYGVVYYPQRLRIRLLDRHQDGGCGERRGGAARSITSRSRYPSAAMSPRRWVLILAAGARCRVHHDGAQRDGTARSEASSATAAPPSFIGTHPTWNPALVGLTDARSGASRRFYFQSDWIPGWYGDSVGHQQGQGGRCGRRPIAQ